MGDYLMRAADCEAEKQELRDLLAQRDREMEDWARIREIAADWRSSHELVGIAVRNIIAKREGDARPAHSTVRAPGPVGADPLSDSPSAARPSDAEANEGEA